jgi:uncharacterized protein YdiU (UPF0061 family)
VGMWNCARLGEALMVAEGAAVAREAWQAALDGYWPAFNDEYARRMRDKLGFATERDEDAALLRELLTLMQADRVDYTRGFRTLSEGRALEPLFRSRDGLAAWMAGYEARVAVEGRAPAERQETMRRVNPKYVLRNWVAQEAIAAAEGGACELIDRLRALFAAPFEEHPGMERFAEPPSPEARHLEVSCSS